MTPFTQEVIRLIKKIPSGKVSTYGQIAKLAGKPQGARGVSWIISSCTKGHQLPWFRIIGGQGKISIPWGTRGYQRQRMLLEQEGVDVSEEGKIDLKVFGWEESAARKYPSIEAVIKPVTNGPVKISRSAALALLRENALTCDLHTLAHQFGITVRTATGLNKGWAGQTLERIADLTNSNLPSRDGADFELKSVKMALQNGQYTPKETVKITSIHPEKITEETFETSVLWNKLQRLVIVGCEYSAPDKARAVVVSEFDLQQLDLIKEIRGIWEDVQHLIMNGEITKHFNLGTSSELLQIRPLGNGKRLSTCIVTGEKFPARAFYATRRLLNEMLKDRSGN